MRQPPKPPTMSPRNAPRFPGSADAESAALGQTLPSDCISANDRFLAVSGSSSVSSHASAQRRTRYCSSSREQILQSSRLSRSAYVHLSRRRGCSLCSQSMRRKDSTEFLQQFAVARKVTSRISLLHLRKYGSGPCETFGAGGLGNGSRWRGNPDEQVLDRLEGWRP